MTTPRALAAIRVLLIEDEPDSRELTRTALSRFGADVTAVSSSAEAVSVIVSALPGLLPDVIVSDLGMPVEGGYVFISQRNCLGKGSNRRLSGREPASLSPWCADWRLRGRSPTMVHSLHVA